MEKNTVGKIRPPGHPIYADQCGKEGMRMCGTDFCKGVGAGVAMGLALGMTLKPKKRRLSCAARLLKLASRAVDQVGTALGF